MIQINIPGYRELQIEHLLLDYNGTIAKDGRLLPGVAELLGLLSERLSVSVLTADTHGSAARELSASGIPLTLRTFPSAHAMEEKRLIAASLPKGSVCAVGNGRNDELMLKEAALSIAVAGEEGMYAGLFREADLFCPSIKSALELLLFEKRLIASLRG